MEPRNITAALLSLALAGALQAQIPVKIDPSDQRQVLEGWGTSLCWWAHSLGGWRAAALDSMAVQVVDTATGLGMNIFRYNIGGGDVPGHTHMRKDAGIPGFKPTETGAYDWNADAAQRRTMAAVLAKVRKPVLEAFSNSPPWWMTKSGCASGNTDGSNNLKEEYYDDFADYLTEVVRHFRDTLGIAFRTLAPFNEPNSNWWTANGKQEGCKFERATQPRLIQEVGRRLASKGLTGTTVSAADANSIGEMVGNAQSYDAATLAYVSQFNTHSYFGTDVERRSLKDLARRKGMRLWQSETGPLSWPGGGQFEAAMWSASLILKDLREMQAEAWIDWQVAGGGIWGVIDYNAGAQTARMNKKGFAYAQFSRFIRPGARVIGSGSANTLAAYHPDGGVLTLVVVNDSAGPRKYAFDLSGFAVVPAAAQAYRTSATENAAATGAIAVAGKTLVLDAVSMSVTTLVLRGTSAMVLGIRWGRAGRGGPERVRQAGTPLFPWRMGVDARDAAGRLKGFRFR